jgi:hypothetical protein
MSGHRINPETRWEFQPQPSHRRGFEDFDPLRVRQSEVEVDAGGAAGLRARQDSLKFGTEWKLVAAGDRRHAFGRADDHIGLLVGVQRERGLKGRPAVGGVGEEGNFPASGRAGREDAFFHGEAGALAGQGAMGVVAWAARNAPEAQFGARDRCARRESLEGKVNSVVGAGSQMHRDFDPGPHGWECEAEALGLFGCRLKQVDRFRSHEVGWIAFVVSVDRDQADL